MQLSEDDKPAGIKKEVIRAFGNLVILLDSRFLSRQSAHNAVLRLIRSCISDEDSEDEALTEDEWLMMDEERSSERFKKSAGVQGQDYEEDLVDLLCHICSRVRSAPELLNIFMKGKRRTLSLPDEAIANGLARSASPTGSDSSTSTLRAGQTSSQQVSSPASGANSPSIAQPSAATDSEEATLYTFPIFTYLLRFIHREGKIGEVARAGALFCINMALGRAAFASAASSASSTHDTSQAKTSAEESTLALARFISESDFAEVFGASLGAVYGLLPGKLVVSPSGAAPMDAGISLETVGGATGMSVGTGSKSEAEKQEISAQLVFQGVEMNDTPFVKGQAKLLVSLLDFAQDVLSAALDDAAAPATVDSNERAQALARIGDDIAQSMANTIRNNFLQNILYPSMLECSDADWSAVAVMSYLEVMLLSIEDSNPLANIIIGYLSAEDISKRELSEQDSRKTRRKSTALLMMEGSQNLQGRNSTSYFTDAYGRYTLKDLIMGHITPTTNPDTLTAALRLATSLFERHGRFAIKHLTTPIYDTRATPFPALAQSSAVKGNSAAAVPLEQHFIEMRTLFALVDKIEGSVVSGSGSLFGFDQALGDTEEALGRDSLFALGMQSFQASPIDTPSSLLNSLRHRISPGDRFYRSLIKLLCAFFTQPPEVNIALTGLLSTLALCPLRSIEGWLVFPPDGHVQGENTPILLAILQSLCQQVASVRGAVAEFDSLLSERRSGLIFVNNLQDAIAIDQDDEVNLMSPRLGNRKNEEDRVDAKLVAATMERLDSGDKVHAKVKVIRSEVQEEAKPLDDAEETKPKQREGFARWFGGSRNKVKTAPQQSPDASVDVVEAAVPFAQHYAKSHAIQVQVRAVRPPKGAWSSEGGSSKKRRLRFGGPSGDTPDDSGDGEEVFYPGKEAGEDEEGAPLATVSLSAVLDNVVILQETIKELAAVVQTRRSVGIDLLAMAT